MTTNGSNGEPSMDEILASIRQIIQEEPSDNSQSAGAQTPAGGTAAVTSGSQTDGKSESPQQPRAAQAAGPLSRRLADAANGSASTDQQLPTEQSNTGGEPTTTRAVIDEDIADLFEDEAASTSATADQSTATTAKGAQSNPASEISHQPTPRPAAADLKARFPDAASGSAPTDGPLIPPTARSVAAMSKSAAQPFGRSEGEQNSQAAKSTTVPAKFEPETATSDGPTLIDRLTATPAVQTDPLKAKSDGDAAAARDLGPLSIDPVAAPQASGTTEPNPGFAPGELRPFGKDFDPPAGLRPSRERPWDGDGTGSQPAVKNDLTAADPSPGGIDFDSIFPSQFKGAESGTPAGQSVSATLDGLATPERSEPTLGAAKPEPKSAKTQPTGDAVAPSPAAQTAGSPTNITATQAKETPAQPQPNNEASAQTPQPASATAASASFSSMTGLPSFSEKPVSATDPLPSPGGQNSAPSEALDPATPKNADEAVTKTETKEDAGPKLDLSDDKTGSQQTKTAASPTGTDPKPSTTADKSASVTPAHEASKDPKSDPQKGSAVSDPASQSLASQSMSAALDRVTGGAAQPKPATTTQTTDEAIERTLDETAAELLRPMVREWLDRNMPRIFEKALQMELANGVAAPTPVDAASKEPSQEAADTSRPGPSKH
ncbi:MAG: DUF2497 domain-containing protein [Pseudomonadota bacterium]